MEAVASLAVAFFALPLVPRGRTDNSGLTRRSTRSRCEWWSCAWLLKLRLQLLLGRQHEFPCEWRAWCRCKCSSSSLLLQLRSCSTRNSLLMSPLALYAFVGSLLTDLLSLAGNVFVQDVRGALLLLLLLQGQRLVYNNGSLPQTDRVPEGQPSPGR